MPARSCRFKTRTSSTNFRDRTPAPGQFGLQPGAGDFQSRITVSGETIEDGGGFFHAEPAIEAQLDDASLACVDAGERVPNCLGTSPSIVSRQYHGNELIERELLFGVQQPRRINKYGCR